MSVAYLPRAKFAIAGGFLKAEINLRLSPPTH
jgi:hypothetical protein